MELVIRKGEGNTWGYVESFKCYRFGDTGNIKVTVGVTSDGEFTTPHILRGGKFSPLSDIESEGEVGLTAYMKAKKPIYSLLADGFIITLKCYLDYTTGELIEEKSGFDVYSVLKTTPVNATEAKLHTVRLLEIPEQLNVLAINLMKKVVETGTDREKFLKNRF